MKLDEYQIQHQNRIADNLYFYSLKLNDLRHRSELVSDVYYTNRISDLLDCLKNVVKDVKELELHSARKADREVKNNA